MGLVKAVFRNGILVIALLLVSFIVTAQPGGEDNPPGDPEDPTVPITGIEILVAIGGVMGIKKIIGRSRQKIN